MGKEFLHDLNIHGAGQIQFKTTAGANAGKIDQDGNNLVLTNAVGDILLGDGSSDVFIGDGTNNVDIIFEQSGSIKGDGSAVTLTLGGANTTLNLENPNFSGNVGMSSKLTFTTTNGYILFDHEPSGDTGAYDGTTSVPLLKVDRSGNELTILERVSEYGALLLGNDDSVIIAGGDTRNTLRSNITESDETVIVSAEGGMKVIGFPDNMSGGWSARQEFRFYTGGTNAGLNGLWIGSGGNTQFIDLNRNLKNIGTIDSGAIEASGVVDGPFTALRLANQKTYGSGTGTNETVRFAMGISESGQGGLDQREGFVIETFTISESDSSNINTDFKVRDGGTIGTAVRLTGADKSTTFFGNLNLGDGNKIQAGDSQDLQIYHDGSNSYINDNGTGDLLLRRGLAGGLNITGTGTLINGTLTVNGNSTLGGDVTIGKSASSSSSGSKSLIFKGVDDNGTEIVAAKILTVDSQNNPKGQDLNIQVAADEGTLFTAMQVNSVGFVGIGVTGGSVGNHLHLADNYSLGLGTGSDLTLVHSGTNGNIGNSTGDLTIDSANAIILDADSGGTQLMDGGVKFGTFSKNNDNFHIVANRQDGDIIFFGNDSGSSVTALTLDMSLAGEAKFNGNIRVPGEINLAGSTTFSIDLQDHSNYTWLRNEPGQWSFQSGTSGDDWTQSWQIYVPNVNSDGGNATFVELGQRHTNDTTGEFKGIKIVKRTGAGVVDGDFQAGATTVSDLTVTGNLSITGDIDSYNVNNLDVVDKLITIGKGQTEANSNGSGIFVDGSSASLLWDESNNTWDFNKSLDIVGNLNASGNATFAGTIATTGITVDSRLIIDSAKIYDNAASGNNKGFRISGSGFIPINGSGTDTTNIVDLGNSTTRFKDLYLSGNATLAGNITTSGNIILSGASNEIIKSNGSIRLNIDSDANQSDRIFIVSTGANSELFRVDESGNGTFAGEVYTTGKLGIGTTDPNSDGYSFAEDLVIKGGNSSSDGAGMTILANGKQYGVIAFADSANDSIGEIFYDHNADRMYFRAGGNNNTLYVDNTAIVVDGNIGVTGTVDGVDIQTLNTTANAALPKAGGTMTGTLTIDGQGSSADKLLVKGSARIALENANATDSFYLSNTGGNNASILDLGGALSLVENGNATFAGSITVGSTGAAPLLFSKSTYGDMDTDAFYRIKFQDQGGVHNDVGIGQTATGNLGFNITAGKDFLFNGGTTGNALTLTSGGNATFAGDLFLGDNKKVVLGGSTDFLLYHNGTDSVIDNNTGDLYITNKANDKDIIFRSDDGSGGFTEYFRVDGGTENVKFSKDLQLLDNVDLTIGSSADFAINHNGSNTFITHKGTGELYIRNTNDDGDLIFQGDDGSGGNTEYFKIDGGDTEVIVSKAFTFLDNVKAKFGGGNDLQIYHNGSNSIIEDAGTGDLVFKFSNDLLIQGQDDANLINCNEGNSVQLYYNGSEKLETKSGGIEVTGTITATGNILDRNIPMVIHASFDDTTSSTAVRIIPLMGSITETTVSGGYAPHFFIAPYACVLKKVIFKNVAGSISSSFTTELKAYKNGSVTSNSSSGELTASSSAITWTPSAHADITYAAGDKFALVYQKSASSKYWQDVAVTIVFTLTDYDI